LLFVVIFIKIFLIKFYFIILHIKIKAIQVDPITYKNDTPQKFDINNITPTGLEKINV
jgi:hypothetical protein